MDNKQRHKTALFWFRRDLRLEDNHGLFHALNSNDFVLPIFIFDKKILEKLDNKSDRRVAFIHESLVAIHQKLKQWNSSLLVLFETPQNAFSKILETYDVTAVYTNHDYEPYSRQRDETVSEFLQHKGIAFHSFKDQVIFEKNEVLKPDHTPYTVFTPYSKAWKNKLTPISLQSFEVESLKSHFLPTTTLPFPTLHEIGFQNIASGVEQPNVNESLIKNYHLTRNIPSLEGTTHLSVHLRFGTVSIRQLVAKALVWNEQWLNELIWREFFMMILYHFPQVVEESFKKNYDLISWRNNDEEFALWCAGKTGYPMVDAGMRQLNETGWMHNRVRMVVASFLTKHLLIDWRWGAAYFAEKLLDFELSLNNGNWQWAAGCGCDAAPYFRVFNPDEQVKKFDPEHRYLRRWLPEMIGGNYPQPIIAHAFARDRALKTYKEALT